MGCPALQTAGPWPRAEPRTSCPRSGYALFAALGRRSVVSPAKVHPVRSRQGLAHDLYPLTSVRATKDRRIVLDRRRQPTTIVSTLRFGGRRRAFRREEERHHQYVDHLPPRLAVVVVSLFVMSAIDAVCTLAHIASGGAEVNPVMDWMLLHGIPLFLVAKALMTILGATFLAVHQNFRLTVPTLYTLVCGYVLLMFLHAFLILS